MEVNEKDTKKMVPSTFGQTYTYTRSASLNLSKLLNSNECPAKRWREDKEVEVETRTHLEKGNGGMTVRLWSILGSASE